MEYRLQLSLPVQEEGIGIDKLLPKAKAAAIRKIQSGPAVKAELSGTLKVLRERGKAKLPKETLKPPDRFLRDLRDKLLLS